jgi:hypothetical protein
MASIIAVDQRLIALLPTRSRLKLGRLIQQARDAEDYYQSAIKQREQMLEESGALGAERRTLVARAAETGTNEVPDTGDLDAALDQLNGEITRLDAEVAKRAQRRQDLAQLVARCRNSLEQVPLGQVLARAHQHAAPRLNGETAPDALHRIRAEITKLQAELRSIAIAPLPSAELKAKARAYVAEIGKAAVPMLMAERGQFEVRWQPGVLASGPMGPACAALIAALFPDALYQMLEQQIDAVKGTGLSERERPQREAQIRERIHVLEAQEESLIEADDNASDSSWGLIRRVDADPMVVLGTRPSVAQARAS